MTTRQNFSCGIFDQLVCRLTNLNWTETCDCMKKLIALVLVLVCALVLVGCSTVNADQDNHTNTISKADALMEATNDYIKTYMGSTDVSCVLGKQLSAYRLSADKLEPIDYEMYPVFVEDKVVAFTTCILSDTGEYLPGCGVDFAESFWQKYSEHPDTAIAIVYAQEGAYLVREGVPPALLHETPIKDCDSIQELDKYCTSLEYTVI